MSLLREIFSRPIERNGVIADVRQLPANRNRQTDQKSDANNAAPPQSDPITVLLALLAAQDEAEGGSDEAADEANHYRDILNQYPNKDTRKTLATVSAEVQWSFWLAWEPYEGKRGGRGWIDRAKVDAKGRPRVIYGGDRPGEKREKQEEHSGRALGVIRKVFQEEDLTDEDIAILAESAGYLTHKQIREARALLGAKFGGKRGKTDRVDALRKHVQGLMKSSQEWKKQAEAQKGDEPPAPPTVAQPMPPESTRPEGSTEQPGGQPQPERKKKKYRKLPGKVKEGATLFSVVLARGGIRPSADVNVDEDLKQHGLLGVVRKNGRHLDELADELVKEGYISVPPDRNADDYLIELLQDRAYHLHADLSERHAEQEAAHYQDIADAREQAEQLGITDDDLEEALRGGAQAAQAEVAEATDGGFDQEYGSDAGVAAEDAGSVDDFEFGANVKEPTHAAQEGQEQGSDQPQHPPGEEGGQTVPAGAGDRAPQSGSAEKEQVDPTAPASHTPEPESGFPTIAKEGPQRILDQARFNSMRVPNEGDEPKFDKKEYPKQLAWAWKDEEDPEVRKAVEPELLKAGLEPSAERGTTVPFDAREHETTDDVRPGDSVVVDHPGWNHQGRQVTRAEVRKSESKTGNTTQTADHTNPTSHIPALAAIPAGQSAWVAGHAVKRLPNGTYRLETDKHHVTGTAEEVASRIARNWTDQKPERSAAEAALARAAAHQEPDPFSPDYHKTAIATHRKRTTLPDGARVVSLDPNTHGRTGSVSHDEAGRLVVKADGSPDVRISDFEPLDEKYSWRGGKSNAETAAPTRQGSLLEGIPEPEPTKPDANAARREASLAAHRGELLTGRQKEALGPQGTEGLVWRDPATGEELIGTGAKARKAGGPAEVYRKPDGSTVTLAEHELSRLELVGRRETDDKNKQPADTSKNLLTPAGMQAAQTEREAKVDAEVSAAERQWQKEHPEHGEKVLRERKESLGKLISSELDRLSDAQKKSLSKRLEKATTHAQMARIQQDALAMQEKGAKAKPTATQAQSTYDAIKKDLPNLSVDQIRARHAELAKMPRTALAEVLTRLGYPADGTREQLVQKLLDNLLSLKISQEQTNQIV